MKVFLIIVFLVLLTVTIFGTLLGCPEVSVFVVCRPSFTTTTYYGTQTHYLTTGFIAIFSLLIAIIIGEIIFKFRNKDDG